MTKTFITSDLHFFHQGILKFCPKTRPYKDIEEMHWKMVLEWNSSVGPEDLVYLLGDVSFGDTNQTNQILQQLQGRIRLVRGNHDNKTLRCPVVQSRFETIDNYLEIDYKKTKVVMFHFPILEWNNCHHGSVHLHGHTHGDPTGLEKWRARDVGFDATGKVVSLLDDVIADAKTSEKKGRH
jgi:calcineurin-like phosphoesterase family protein